MLVIDIVGYSKFLIDEQSETLQKLNQVVRQAAAVCEAEAAGELIRLPSGDGMALVFTRSAEAAVESALAISVALGAGARVPVRMGIHSGPVQQVVDVDERINIAGSGINIAQRGMDCGDAGHILLSKCVADDLAQYRRWQPSLHDLGECEVKHGVLVSVANLYGEGFGNPATPEKFKAPLKISPPFRRNWIPIALATAGAVIVIAALLFFRGEPAPSAARAPAKSIAVLPFETSATIRRMPILPRGCRRKSSPVSPKSRI